MQRAPVRLALPRPQRSRASGGWTQGGQTPGTTDAARKRTSETPLLAPLETRPKAPVRPSLKVARSPAPWPPARPPRAHLSCPFCHGSPAPPLPGTPRFWEAPSGPPSRLQDPVPLHLRVDRLQRRGFQRPLYLGDHSRAEAPRLPGNRTRAAPTGRVIEGAWHLRGVAPPPSCAPGWTRRSQRWRRAREAPPLPGAPGRAQAGTRAGPAWRPPARVGHRHSGQPRRSPPRPAPGLRGSSPLLATRPRLGSFPYNEYSPSRRFFPALSKRARKIRPQ